MKQLLCYLIAFSVFLPSLLAAEFRQWKDTKGKAIEAKLIKDNGDGTIHIQKKDGWTGNVPLNLLSAEDQAYVKTVGSAVADEPLEPNLSQNFEIIRIRRDHVPGFINTKSGWEYKIKCVKVDLRYEGTKTVSDAQVKAYFYNREGKEIERFPSPPRRQDESGKYINAIQQFEPDEKYEVFFPISKAIEERDWKTVLITFGNLTETSALTDPESELIAFDFDEKKLIYPKWDETNKDAQSSGNTQAVVGTSSSNLIPEMRTVKRDKHPYATFVDKLWQYQIECLMTEIRVQETLPTKISVKAYFFDDQKNLVATHEKPAMVNLGRSVYSDLPVITEKNTWYPVTIQVFKKT